MQPVIAPKRVMLEGGTWTPKVAGGFEDGHADAPFVFEGRVEIKELGGHLDGARSREAANRCSKVLVWLSL